MLISSATLRDPNFARTIVLLLNVDADGCLGVVLNRPSSLAVTDVLEGWGELADGPAVLFRGGPVDTDSALGVATVIVSGLTEPLGWRRLYDSTGIVDLDTPTELVASSLSGLRIFAGYAGWSAGQLDAEIGEGSWFVVPAEAGDVFSADPDALWQRVLRRQGGELAFMATMPADPRHN